ncbi:DinB superfamily protein [Chitinophaga costaii]|uniref:DinB superfamily protein n=1 Tax=Chitinophaga costaii TaxID=1335309 RepID=A0A1C4CEG0_9BACT|nr:putative metal-dependent hydrolase [Chitinophaga costaii]PUZ27120.1 putative metal-dependent hydrolase [Chitinophaga costaii]SCC17495.1 DinB superfamily protein [Chitinophaga costaii]
METDDIEVLKYPIGHFEWPEEIFQHVLEGWINDIRHLPTLLEIAVQNLDEAQLLTPYRPGGWNVAQVVHHVADSHINAYTRFKLALTEDNPTIKPYEEGAWAELPDTKQTAINVSNTLLHALHKRWTVLMDNLSPEQWERTFIHPASKKTFKLKEIAGNYAWHGRHHLMHIIRLKERMGW